MTTPTIPTTTVEPVTPDLSTQQLAVRTLDAHYITSEIKAGDAKVRAAMLERLSAGYAETGAKSIDVNLDGQPAATFSLVTGTDAITVPDAAMLDYAEAVYGDVAIETIVRVRPANAKQIIDAAQVRTDVITGPDGAVVTETPDGHLLAAEDGVVYDTTTGDALPDHTAYESAVVDTIKGRVIPGATVRPAGEPTSFRVSWKKPGRAGGVDGKALAAAHVDGRIVNEFGAEGITAVRS